MQWTNLREGGQIQRSSRRSTSRVFTNIVACGGMICVEVTGHKRH